MKTAAAPERKEDHKVNHGLVFLQAMMIPALLAGGWFFRGMMPSPPPMGLTSGGPGGPPLVVTASVAMGGSEGVREYVGHVEAIQRVSLRAQVAGKITGVHFEEGALVQAGALLFSIERDPYAARLALLEAGLAQATSSLPGVRASLSAARANYTRADKYLKRLENADARSVVQANMDAARADFLQAEAAVAEVEAAVAQAEARIQQAEAELELARIDLAYTEIHAPITGRIGRVLVTKGNLVSPASGPLADIVEVDPVRVVFSMTDRDYLDTLNRETGAQAYQTRLRLPNGGLFDGTGVPDFEDNEMNPRTGTLAMRCRFENAEGFLVPGSYVTVLLERCDAPKLPVVAQAAVMHDAAGDYVYVVDAAGRVEERRVSLADSVGDTQPVRSGLAVGEQVIVAGTQKVRAGQTVRLAAAPSDAGV